MIPYPDPEAIQQLLLVLDLAGTFVFAISGAMLGVNRRLDLLGVLVLAFAASTVGGIARDLLLGSVPPAAVRDWRYGAVAMTAGVVIFVWHARIHRIQAAISVFDAAGLGFFAVAGAQKALAYGLHPVMAASLGMLTGIGGGMARDLLVARTPSVLRPGHLYAVAALLGATVVVVGRRLGWPVLPTAIAGFLACFVLRLAALRHDWRLPTALPRDEGRDDEV